MAKVTSGDSPAWGNRTGGLGTAGWPDESRAGGHNKCRGRNKVRRFIRAGPELWAGPFLERALKGRASALPRRSTPVGFVGHPGRFPRRQPSFGRPDSRWRLSPQKSGTDECVRPHTTYSHTTCSRTTAAIQFVPAQPVPALALAVRRPGNRFNCSPVLPCFIIRR